MHESRKVGLGTTVEYTERKFKKGVSFECPYQHLPWSPVSIESLRLKFTNEPSIFVDGDLDESIKRYASDRLGDLVPQVRARTSPGVFRDMALLGLCLELSFKNRCSFQAFAWKTSFIARPRWPPATLLFHMNIDQLVWAPEVHTVKSLFCAPTLIYVNRCRTTGAKKREVLEFSMANHGLEIVEKDAAHLSKNWKEMKKEEKNPAKVKCKPNRRLLISTMLWRPAVNRGRCLFISTMLWRPAVNRGLR